MARTLAYGSSGCEESGVGTVDQRGADGGHLLDGFREHPRTFERFTYVYPVLSRRAGGVSLGVNLNPDKRCNFDCVYCQVDRRELPPMTRIDLSLFARELEAGLELVLGGALWEHPRFADTPAELRRLNDIALSGDAEPTTERRFAEVVEIIADAKRARGLDEVKIVLITDSACLHLGHVKRGLEVMDRDQGEIWAKLDAGTEAFYREVNRSRVPFARILLNLRETAALRPIVIQTLFFARSGVAPPEPEIAAYAERLVEIEQAGAISEVHVHTIARDPAEPFCTPLSKAELEAIAGSIRPRLRAAVRIFGGA